MKQINTKTSYLIEREQDSKIWTFAGEFNKNNPDCYADSQFDRTSIFFTEKEATRFNDLIDLDGCATHVGIVITKRGLRFIPF